MSWDSFLSITAKPVILKKPFNHKYPKTRTSRFACEFTGMPQPKVTWYFNGQRIQNEGRYKVSTILQTRQYIIIKLQIVGFLLKLLKDVHCMKRKTDTIKGFSLGLIHHCSWCLLVISHTILGSCTQREEKIVKLIYYIVISLCGLREISLKFWIVVKTVYNFHGLTFSINVVNLTHICCIWSDRTLSDLTEPFTVSDLMSGRDKIFLLLWTWSTFT